jgi:repressor LexA
MAANPNDVPKLTKRQQDVYDFICEKIRERGYGPTVREIGQAFGIKSPNGVICHLVALVKKGLISREPNMSRAISVLRPSDRAPGIPLQGVIAAGKPIETFEQQERMDFSEMFTKPGFFALKVRGDSMIEDHINDGDYVIVKKTNTARDGQIVVAMVDGNETTLKRFFKEKARFRLEPANSSMKPIFSKKVDVLGVVAGVLRTYSTT